MVPVCQSSRCVVSSSKSVRGIPRGVGLGPPSRRLCLSEAVMLCSANLPLSRPMGCQPTARPGARHPSRGGGGRQPLRHLQRCRLAHTARGGAARPGDFLIKHVLTYFLPTCCMAHHASLSVQLTSAYLFQHKPNISWALHTLHLTCPGARAGARG